MTNRRTVATGALAAVLAMSSMAPASAQFGRGGGNAYTPQAGDRDMRAVLFNWTWHMGMLRGESEVELIQTLEYRAEGTIQINGQACSITPYEEAAPGTLGTAGYRISVNYRYPAYRTQIECTLPNGQVYRNVETIHGEYVWDEDIPGAELVPGVGTATPRPDAYAERMIRLWASPQGAAKAATAAAAGVSTEEAFAENPAGLLDREADTPSLATLDWQGSNAVITYPIPGVPGAMATATLNDDYFPESVVVNRDGDTTEFIYSDFGDFNNPLHRIDAMYPGTIVERHNGQVVRDLRTVITEIGQVYVIVPIPDSIRAAGPATN